jgi:UDP-N-acetylglucosamine:LPS N-acetylglucosamine transferase
MQSAEGLLKLNSNTAGLPSVAEAGVIVATVGAASLSDCSSSRSRSRMPVKVLIFCNSISSCWYTYSSVVAPAGTVTVHEGSVISTPAVPLVNVYSHCNSRRVAQAEFKHSRTPSVAEAGVIVATVEPHHYH